MKIEKPCTLYVQFTGNLPRKFMLYRNNRPYYVRYLNGRTPRIKFNIPDPGNFTGSAPFTVCKQTDIEIPDNLPLLPDYERDRVKDVTIVHNPELVGTPARIYTQEGKIETGRDFKNFPDPFKIFFLLHEIAHLYYKTEEKCDQFALIFFLKWGHNRSTAMYCLTHVLKKSPGNVRRMLKLFDNIQTTQETPLLNEKLKVA